MMIAETPDHVLVGLRDFFAQPSFARVIDSGQGRILKQTLGSLLDLADMLSFT